VPTISNPDAHTYCNANTYSDPNTNPNTHCYAYADTDATSRWL
jgi:hypothetical protein